MEKLMLIAIVGMFAVTAFAQGRPGGAPGRGPSGGGRPPVSAPGRHPDHGPGISRDLAKASAIVGMVSDTLRIFSPRPAPRVIVRESAPRVIVTTPTPVYTTPVVQEVVVEKPVVVEKVVKPEVKKVEPVVLGDKIYYMITFTDGTVKTIEAK